MSNYYIYLNNINKWIMESDNELIWLTTSNIDEAFTDCDIDRVKRIATYIHHDKNIPLHNIIIEKEVIEVHIEQFNLDSEYLQCDLCGKWVHQDTLEYAVYDVYDRICKDCKEDGS